VNATLRKWIGALYGVALLPILINFIMGFGWFHPYDKAVLWAAILISVGMSSWLRKHADQKLAQQFDLLALDANGGLQSDPAAQRFVLKVAIIVLSVVLLIGAMNWYGHRAKDDFGVQVLVMVMLVVICVTLLRMWYGSIYEIERDAGKVLSLRRGGKVLDIPWSDVQSVSVEKPRGIWQVVLKYRLEGESKDRSVVVIPLGFLKMSTVSAEKLQAALDAKRTETRKTA
jgi:hypothetical protein